MIDIPNLTNCRYYEYYAPFVSITDPSHSPDGKCNLSLAATVQEIIIVSALAALQK
jgi:hypothetical protein